MDTAFMVPPPQSDVTAFGKLAAPSVGPPNPFPRSTLIYRDEFLRAVRRARNRRGGHRAAARVPHRMQPHGLAPSISARDLLPPPDRRQAGPHTRPPSTYRRHAGRTPTGKHRPHPHATYCRRADRGRPAQERQLHGSTTHVDLRGRPRVRQLDGCPRVSPAAAKGARRAMRAWSASPTRQERQEVTARTRPSWASRWSSADCQGNQGSSSGRDDRTDRRPEHARYRQGPGTRNQRQPDGVRDDKYATALPDFYHGHIAVCMFRTCACARPDRGHPARAPTPRPEDTDVRLLRQRRLGPGRGPGHYGSYPRRRPRTARPSRRSRRPDAEKARTQGRRQTYVVVDTYADYSVSDVNLYGVPAPSAPSSSPFATTARPTPAWAGLGGAGVQPAARHDHGEAAHEGVRRRRLRALLQEQTATRTPATFKDLKPERPSSSGTWLAGGPILRSRVDPDEACVGGPVAVPASTDRLIRSRTEDSGTSPSANTTYSRVWVFPGSGP